MIKLCGISLCKPLEILFKSCIPKSDFPSEWEKANVALIHNKNNNQSLKIYGPISLFQIFDKMFERIIYNNMLLGLHS